MSARSKLLAVGGSVVALLFAHGCGSEDDGDGNDAGVAAAGGSGGAGASGAAGGAGGVGGSGGSVGGTAGSGATGGAAGCSPSSQLPPGVPDGWTEWTKYSCACRLFVPEAGAAVLPAVQWEPCPQGVFGSPTCRRVKTDWTQTSASSLSGFAQFWFDTALDKAYLQLSRIHYEDDPNVRFKTVEEVDGAVRNAFLQVNPYNEGCEALTHHLGDGHFAFGMMGDSWTGPMLGTREGVIAGPIGTEDPIVIKQDMPAQSTSHWWVSQKWLFERRIETHAHSWDQSETVTVHDPGTDPEAMPSHGLVGVGDAAFFEVGVAGYRGVMSWTKAAGAQPLLRWLGDWTQGAGNFNTDGVDMVWTHGEGKTDKSSQEYPIRSVKTAPFTTDLAVVQSTQKRLRSDPAQLSTEPYGIGCGYAGRNFDAGNGPSIATHLLIVRLSDGVSWTISAPPASQGVLLGKVMGFTCEELFATAQFPDDGMTIVRIRLDSLGPGTPPD